MSPIERCVTLDLAGNPVVLRPTFCNIPHWAEWTLYIMAALAVFIFALGIWRHYRTWMAGQPDVPERNRGQRMARLRMLLKYGLGQRKTMERRLPGAFHNGIFYGFLLLFIGTALATIDWDITRPLGRLLSDGTDPLAGRILRGDFYLWYEAVLDGAGLIFLLGLGVAIWRRYIVEPHHVIGAWDFMIWSLVLINVSGFLVEGLRIYITQPILPFKHWSWAGYGLASMLWSLDVADPMSLRVAAANAHLWLWLLHAFASLFFIAAIPYTNAIHMVTVSANAWFKSTEAIAPGAALQPIDLENAEVWGVGKLADLNWKQRLGVDSCVRCGRCETVCPAYMSGSPLNPKQIIAGLSGALREEADGPFLVSGEGEVVVGKGLVVEPDALWGCTTCMACVQVCPAFIEIVDDIVDMRRYLTLNEGALPGTSSASLRNMGSAGNPWGYAQEDRLGWAEGLDLPIAQPGQSYELLYWVGCSASYDQRNQKIARSMVQLMQAAGVSFAVMQEESCTCESARRLGDEYLYQTATEANVASIGQYEFQRVLCHCPHCFNTIANEYPQFGGDYEVVHHSQLIQELADSGRLPKSASNELGRVAFHDSCYLGRYNGEFEAPRDSLRAAGVDVVEPARSKENGLCCGGGGGKMWFEGEVDKDVNLIRMEELMEAKPDAVGVACPFCLTMLDSAAKSMGEEDVQVLDIAEVAAAALGSD